MGNDDLILTPSQHGCSAAAAGKSREDDAKLIELVEFGRKHLIAAVHTIKKLEGETIDDDGPDKIAASFANGELEAVGLALLNIESAIRSRLQPAAAVEAPASAEDVTSEGVLEPGETLRDRLIAYADKMQALHEAGQKSDSKYLGAEIVAKIALIREVADRFKPISADQIAMTLSEELRIDDGKPANIAYVAVKIAESIRSLKEDHHG